MFFLFLILTKVAQSVILDSDLRKDQVFNDWIYVLNDQFLPWNGGITEKLINDTFLDNGHHVIFQHIDGNLYLYDPFKYCLHNVSTNGHINPGYYKTRCLALVSIIKAVINDGTAVFAKKIVNFEFVWSLDDFASWNNHLVEDSKTRQSFYVGLGAVRCWNKNTLAFPFFGSHSGWNINTTSNFSDGTIYDYTTGIANKKGVAIFRGGVDRGCSFEKDTVLDFNSWSAIHDHSRKKCGRQLLIDVAKKNSHFVDYQGSNDTFISLVDQSKIYRYVLSVEGFGGWTDRLFDLISKSKMVVMDQEHPCDQWFEPLLKPFVHYIPIAHDFRNLPARVAWANAHPNAVIQIQRKARLFARKYLSKNGIISYAKAFLSLYTARVKYHVNLRKGSNLFENTKK